jgi:type I restriction enzyme S subunit
MQKNENRLGYKKTKVGWLPGDWECLPFTDVFDRVVEPLAPIETETYQEIGVRSHGKGIFHKEPVTGADIGSKRVFHCQPGALVFNIVFAWEQAVAVLSEQERDLIASHRFPMYKGKEGQAFEPFFLSFFKTRKGKNGLGIASPGGAGRNKTLGQKDMEYLYVPKPTRSEQEAIAGVLECWDRAIRNYEKKIEKKRNVKKGLMQRLLSGKQRLPGFRGEWKRVQLGEVSVVNQESLAANTPADTQFYYLDLSCVNKGRITRPRAKLAFDRSPSRARRIFKNGLLNWFCGDFLQYRPA